MLVSTWLLVYLTACGQASKGAGSYQVMKRPHEETQAAMPFRLLLY